MKTKFSFVVLALSILSANTVVKADTPPAQLGIAPPRIEVDLTDRVSNNSITIYNYGKKTKTIDLELINLSDFKDNTVLPPGPQSISRWTLFNPKRFSLEPGESQTVRMSIRPRIKLESGTRYGRLNIRQDMGVDGQSSSSQDGKMTVSIGSNYGLPVIVHVP